MSNAVRRIACRVDLYNPLTPHFVCRQGDTTVLTVEVLARGEPYSLSGYGITLNAVRADCTPYTQQSGIVINGSTAVITLDAGVTAAAGALRLEVSVTDGDSVISTFVITATVNPALISGGTAAPDGSDGIIYSLRLSARAPYIGADGCWWQYNPDTGAFVSTGIAPGGGGYTVGGGLKLEDGALSVDTAAAVEADNTKPVTSGAVFTELGNVEVLLEHI